jgi:NhaP-type Na+/H+ or K+/H+ antiporter
MEVIGVAAGILLLIGFICGYGVRALISRSRRAKATRRQLERMAEEDADEGA